MSSIFMGNTKVTGKTHDVKTMYIPPKPAYNRLTVRGVSQNRATTLFGHTNKVERYQGNTLASVATYICLMVETRTMTSMIDSQG